MDSGNIFKQFVGIDVSKGKLDTFNSKTGEVIQIKNTLEDVEAFIRTLTPADELLIVIDLTGGYEALCVHGFYQAGFNVHRAEGKRVRAFLRAMNQKAKTDKIDAMGLAKYGEKMQENLRLYVPPRKSIKAQVERLGDLKNLLQMEKNRHQAPAQSSSILCGIKRHIKFLENEISALESEVREIISGDELMSQQQEIITSLKGVGEKTAMALIAHMPELGQINRRKVAALAGLAPFARDSGKMSGYRTTKGKGGRPQVKKLMFMCAQSAVRFDAKMKEFYERLLANGKKKMVALTAVMRKMLTIINNKLKVIYKKQVG